MAKRWSCIHILNRTLFLSLWAVIGHLLTASNAVCNKRIIQFAPNHLLPLNRLLSAKKLVVNVRYNPQTNFLLWNWRWNRILSLRISLQSNFWFSKSYDDRCKCTFPIKEQISLKFHVYLNISGLLVCIHLLYEVVVQIKEELTSSNMYAWTSIWTIPVENCNPRPLIFELSGFSEEIEIVDICWICQFSWWQLSFII